MSEEWTPARVSALIALWNEGISTSIIGDRLGVTKNAVVGKVHRIGLPKRGSPIRQKPKPAEIIDLNSLRPGMCSWPEGGGGGANRCTPRMQQQTRESSPNPHRPDCIRCCPGRPAPTIAFAECSGGRRGFATRCPRPTCCRTAGRCCRSVHGAYQ